MSHLIPTVTPRIHDAEAMRWLGTAPYVATATAQAVVARAVIDLVGRAGVPLDDVRDRALDIAAGMSGEVDAEVRILLAEAPAGTGALQ